MIGTRQPSGRNTPASPQAIIKTAVPGSFPSFSTGRVFITPTKSGEVHIGVAMTDWLDLEHLSQDFLQLLLQKEDASVCPPPKGEGYSISYALVSN